MNNRERSFLLSTIQNWEYLSLRKFLLFIESTHCHRLSKIYKIKIAYFARSICASEPLYSFISPSVVSILIDIKKSNSNDYKQSLLQPRSFIIADCLYNVPIDWPSWMYDLLNLLGKLARTVLTQIRESQFVNNEPPKYELANDEEKQTMRDFLHHGTHFAAEYTNVRPRFQTEVIQESKSRKSGNTEPNIQCVKHFKQQFDKPGTMIFRCCLHGVCLGHSQFCKGEGLNDVFSAIFCFYPVEEWPDVGVYDFMCACLGYMMRRSYDRYYA